MREYYKNLNIIYIFVVATASFLWFILKEQTAYEWPSIDMMVFFKRHSDSCFLINDFFTNSISNEPNPRWIFGYFIIFLAEFFNVDWYVISYSLKVILVVATPILYYLTIFAILKKYLNEKQLKNVQILLTTAVLMVIYPPFSGLFSIAWWKPYFIQSSPQNLSLAVGLLAILYVEYGSKITILISVLLFAISTIFHPAIGLFSLLFYILITLPFIFEEYKKYLSLFFGGFLIPAIIIIIIFKPSAPLDSLNFINIYAIENHSSHYHLSNFGTHTPFSWIYSFILMLLLLIIPILYFYKIKANKYFNLSVTFISFFLFIVLLQYIFIDIFPNKIIASIGPVRFSQFIYYMIVLSWILMFSNLTFLNKFNFEFRYPKILISLLISFIFSGIILIDNPKKNIISNNIDLYHFLEFTPKNAVFGVFFGEYMVDIPNIGHRAVFIGNGFPFNESFFLEFQRKTNLLYGSRKARDSMGGSWEGEKSANFYRNLKPNDFIKISKNYRLDFVIIETKFSKNFKNFTPVFENSKIKIYKVFNFVTK